MKVLVLGAGGILGQHLQRCIPTGVEASFTRLSVTRVTWDTTREIYAADLTKHDERAWLLDNKNPDVIVNLAGEGRTDVVEKAPETYHAINVHVPLFLSGWCRAHSRYLVQVSSQGVFGGDCPPYAPMSPRSPVNAYGKQKRDAEDSILRMSLFDQWCIARVTFVLGARLDTRVGRRNPLEDMLMLTEQRQVIDRWFSVSFAHDVAECLWQLALDQPLRHIVHIGHPVRTNRFSLAQEVSYAAGTRERTSIKAVSHDDFPGIAPRPFDTTYAPGALHMWGYKANLAQAIEDWRAQQKAGWLDEKGDYAGP